MEEPFKGTFGPESSLLEIPLHWDTNDFAQFESSAVSGETGAVCARTNHVARRSCLSSSLSGDARRDPAHGQADLVGGVVHAVRRDLVTAIGQRTAPRPLS